MRHPIFDCWFLWRELVTLSLFCVLFLGIGGLAGWYSAHAWRAAQVRLTIGWLAPGCVGEKIPFAGAGVEPSHG